jgi:hypothetical protein
MRSDIDDFLTMMENILSYDLLKTIVSLSYKDHNNAIIKRQKQQKSIVLTELLYVINQYYNDNNIRLYKNNQNQFVLQQKSNCKMMLYSNTGIQQQQLLLTDGNTEQNDIVLFDVPNVPNQRRVKLYIMYI